MATHQVTGEQIHRPLVRMVMTYVDTAGTPNAKIINLYDEQSKSFLTRTLRWAARNGVVITLRPM